MVKFRPSEHGLGITARMLAHVRFSLLIYVFQLCEIEILCQSAGSSRVIFEIFTKN